MKSRERGGDCALIHIGGICLENERFLFWGRGVLEKFFFFPLRRVGQKQRNRNGVRHEGAGGWMIRRSWSDIRATMQGTNWGKRLAGKNRWRNRKLPFNYLAIESDGQCLTFTVGVPL